MNKKIVVIFFVIVTFWFFSQISFAQDMERKLGLGTRVSCINYSDDAYTVYGTKVDVEPDESVMYGVNLTYFFLRDLSLELSVDYTETDVELSALGLSGNAGEFESIPVILSLQTHLFTNTKVSPYLTIGVAYFFNDVDQNDSTIEFIYGPGAEIDVDNSLGFLLGGGIEFFISKRAAVNLDFKYIWTKVDAKVNVPGFTKVDYEIDPFVVGLGIKYYF
jgi:outer membrane protein W